MSLLGLPTELMENIIVYTLFQDRNFESISLACKTTYNVGKSHIPWYTQMRRWQKTVVGPDTDLDGDYKKGECRTTWDVIHAIALDPEIAHFIEYLDLRYVLDWESHNWWDFHDEDPEELESRAEKLVRESTLLKELKVNMDDCFKDLHGNGDDSLGTRVIILLVLLPNLKELTLPKDWGQFMNIDAWIPPHELTPVHTVLPIAEMIRDNPDRTEMPLRKLEKLLPFQEIEYDSHYNGLQIVGEFLGLPTLKTLHVSNLNAVEDGYTGVPFQWPYADTLSNLREIILDGCCIDFHGIGELVEYTPQLESLTYSHATKWHGCGYNWDAGAFTAVVGEKRGNTLKRLSLSIDCMYGDVGQAPFLENFTALEFLEIDVCLFCAPVYDPEKDADNDEPGAWSKSDIPCILDVLPRSVKSNILIAGSDNGEGDVDALRRLLSKPEDIRNRRGFPRLDQLAVRPNNADFVKLCDEVPQDEGALSLRNMFEAADVVLEPVIQQTE